VLRVLLPVGLPPHLLTPLLAFSRQRHPRLGYRAQFREDPVGGLVENFDLAVHFGDSSPVGPWVSREVTRVRVWAIASREYLARRGTPQSPAELAAHDLLAWESPDDDPQKWPLRAGGTVSVQPMFVARHIHLVRQLAIAGHGIALVPDALLEDPGVAPGTLVPVLPDLIGREIGIRVVMPAVLAEIPRIRALLEMVRPFLGNFGL
jgi:DNA-binding transcriptional LysR family regulator